MPLAYLLLGSNLGDRAGHLAAARQLLSARAGTITAASALYETAAWGVDDQPAYLNQVLALDTRLPPDALLQAAQAAEQARGRVRRTHWGSRTLDVDILLYGDELINTPTLSVPHPALPLRRFALVPLAELAPALRHPRLGQTVAELLAACPDQQWVATWTGA